MKKSILFVIVILSFLSFSCKNNKIITPVLPTKEVNVILPYQSDNKGYQIVEIDSCEYIFAWFGAGNGGGTLTHKGNCKYCEQRHKNNK